MILNHGTVTCYQWINFLVQSSLKRSVLKHSAVFSLSLVAPDPKSLKQVLSPLLGDHVKFLCSACNISDHLCCYE